MEQKVPFILEPSEKIILDTTPVQYYGVGISNIGFFGGGQSNSLFGGVTTGMQTKREKSMWDATNCHVYLTNIRIVFVKAQVTFLGYKEKKLENVISEIPFSAIKRIGTGTKMMNPTVELSVKSPSGQIDNLVFAMLGGVSKELKTKRDEWVKAIEKCVAEFSKNIPGDTPKTNKQNEEDPLKILKLRFAKGEITSEEYQQIKDALEG